MAYPLIQATSTSDPTLGTVLPLAYVTNNIAENCNIISVNWTGSVTCTITDSQGNTYQAATSAYNITATVFEQIFYAMNIAGGPNTVTMTLSGSGGTFRFLRIHEFTDIFTSGALDKKDDGLTTTASSVSSNSITTTANDLLFSMCYGSGSINSINNGWNTALSMGTGGYTGFIVQPAGSYTSNFTTASSLIIAGVSIASFFIDPFDPDWMPPMEQPYFAKGEVIGY